MSGARSKEELAQDRGDLVTTAIAEALGAEAASTDEDRKRHERRAEEAVAEAARIPCAP